MAALRTNIRTKLEAYLKGSLLPEKLLETIIAADSVFRRELQEHSDDYMDVDEQKSQPTLIEDEFSQSIIDAIWLHRCKLDES